MDLSEHKLLCEIHAPELISAHTERCWKELLPQLKGRQAPQRAAVRGSNIKPSFELSQKEAIWKGLPGLGAAERGTVINTGKVLTGSAEDDPEEVAGAWLSRPLRSFLGIA